MLVEQVKMNFWVAQLAEMPEAHFAVVGDGDDVVGILGADDGQGEDGVVMAVLG